uniref:Armadillo repeat containing 10 n=1 Tax=Pundamilia nyererei TaxID=303518 RepID=A0A3B4F087_9CICH
MGDITPRFGNMKALLGLVAGAGASYGIYKLISFKRNKKNATGENPGVKGSQQSEVSDSSYIRKQCCLHCESGTVNLLYPKCIDWSSYWLTLMFFSSLLIPQNLIREFDGIHIIAGFLSDPAPEVRVQTLNALNNLCMNIQNQEQIKVYVPQVLELIEMSPVNSDLQLGALRLLTNLSVTDKHQHFLSLPISRLLKVQTLKVLVNLSSNPDMMDDIVQAQAPASVVLLFDERTAPAVLLRLLTFAGNLKAWRPSAQVADELRRKQDCLFRVMLDESSQLHGRLVQLLSHPDGEIQAQVARILT